MIKEIESTYERFSDAFITEIRYNNISDNSVVEVHIKCMNHKKDDEWETIKLIFNDILLFKFIEVSNASSTFINSALLYEEKRVVTIDFFPLIFGGGELKENENSDFIIKCRDIKYEVL